MGEDPIIVKPGVYPGATPEETKKGVCVVIDDLGTWRMENDNAVEGKIKVEQGRIYFSMPVEGPFIVADDFTPPFPDPPVPEDPPVERKKKKAILRLNTTLTDINLTGTTAPTDSRQLAIAYVAVAKPPAPGGGD
jgi:hypothetical protein